MTEEQIKQKAEAEADKVIIGSGMDRASVIHLKHLLVTMYMQGATEATKELEKENAELKAQQFSLRNERNTFLAQNEQYEEDLIDFNDQLTKAKEIILRLYNAGRDVLMCRAEEKAYDNLSNAINDKSIEQFLSEVEK